MTKFIYVILLVVISALLFVSCAPPPSARQIYSYGDEGIKDVIQTDLQNLLVKGETDKNTVLNCFGKPSTTTIDGMGNETWVYSYTESIINMEYVNALDMGKISSNANIKVITIVFDETSKVSNFWANESNTGGFGKKTIEIY